jgi:FkbM family methyltransferase
MSKKFKKVFSFEPQEKIYNILNKNIQKNKINNIITFRNAVGNENNYVKISCDKNIVHNSIKKINNNGCEIVKQIRLDDIIFDKKISYIKIDVEGYEYQVLIGAIQLITNNKPVIILEEHNDIITFNEPKSFQLLESLNYKILRLLPYLDDYIAIPL